MAAGGAVSSGLSPPIHAAKGRGATERWRRQDPGALTLNASAVSTIRCRMQLASGRPSSTTEQASARLYRKTETADDQNLFGDPAHTVEMVDHT